MPITLCQHEWVEQCQLRYKVDPPVGYHFENAHYPLSERLGGTETTALWYPDHIIHGCLQTLSLDYPCLDTRKWKVERAIVESVYPDYLAIYDEVYRKCKSYAGKKRAAVTNVFLHRDKTSEGKSRHAVNMGMKTLTTGGLRKAVESRCRPIQVVDPTGVTTIFPSITEASRFHSLDRSGITRCLKEQRAMLQGKNKGFFFSFI